MVYVPGRRASNLYDPSAAVVVVSLTGPFSSKPVSSTVAPAMPFSPASMLPLSFSSK
jgi:hypothetical protein